MDMPDFNNVYGNLMCTCSLEGVADLLRYRLGLSPQQVWVKKSQFDGVQTLRIDTDVADFETIKLSESNLYLFNGAVGGSQDKVCKYVKNLFNILSQGGYKSSFEIYDSNFNCIQVVNA